MSRNLQILITISVGFLLFSPTKSLAMETRDGGIGESTHYLNEVPTIQIDPKIDNIIYPLFGTPAIKKQGETLTIKVDTKGAQPSNWDVQLNQTNHSPAKKNYKLPVTQIKKGTSYWKESRSIYEITITIPKDVPEKLYDLNISYIGDGEKVSDKEQHSVKVVEKYDKNFTFMHLTDLHVGSPRNLQNPGEWTEAGFWNPDKEKRWLYLQKTIQEVNLLKPDFIVVTGDLMFGQINPQEYIYEYEETYQMLQKLNVPVYLVPGNHDYYAQDATLSDGAKYWEDYFGPQYFSFDYGPYAHFIGYNSFDWHKFDRSGHGTVSVPTWGGQIRDKQLNWIKNDLAKNAESTPRNQVQGLFSHHNPLWQDRKIWPEKDPDVQKYWKQYDQQHNPQNLETLLLGENLGVKYDQQWHGEGANKLTDVMKNFEVDISLHGHTHKDDVTKKDDILYTTTAAIELTGDPWVGYRLFKMKNGNFSFYNYENPESSMPVYENGNTAGGVMSLESTYEKPNDGNSVSQSARVTNRLNKAITVTLPFYMNKGDYTVTEGMLTEDYSIDGAQYLKVLVTIPANSKKTIEVNLNE